MECYFKVRRLQFGAACAWLIKNYICSLGIAKAIIPISFSELAVRSCLILPRICVFYGTRGYEFVELKLPSGLHYLRALKHYSARFI